MFALYPSLKEVLDQGSTLFIDELNARLHPLLVRNIILTFLSPEINTRNAQLVFTTHDIWQFSNELLQWDEIWMVNKNRDGVSELYSLVEFKDEDGNKVRWDRNKRVGARVPELGYYLSFSIHCQSLWYTFGIWKELISQGVALECQ